MNPVAIWLVIYSMGHVGAVFGPLPYDMVECEVRRDDINAETTRILTSGIAHGGMPVPERLLDKMATFHAACLRQPDRPQPGR